MVPSLFPKDLRHNFLALLPDQFQFSEVGFKNGIVDNKIRNKDEFLLNFEHIREVSPNTSESVHGQIMIPLFPQYAASSSGAALNAH